MSVIHVDQTLDCRGLACPMPIVKTKKAMSAIHSGQVIEVLATDKGSLADFQAWASNTGHQYLGTVHEGNVLKHFIRKANPDEVKEELKYMHTVTNGELLRRIEANEKLTVIDVREPAEYAFNRIPGAVSIPFGDLEQRWDELDPNQTFYMICRTGNRSDRACQLLADKGFTAVANVLNGMSDWSGPTESNQ
ncbi:sulfurtransferase TusA family protein [Paenibacillus sp. WQ 127069]|uniref:Sulfurtransferase TusA family protein n=1 Tax=Paenibacillus baimaensis TaxID=2982185 RepID=A0ABT2USQ7_9BACL|nr:sulfurtransferase TusA family protein [Paenibacillus sp. WQ 127069]MCU6797669.1 sulfurtransferase TusA family protein [Paenibacillus sp. WQ 127069]